MCACTIYTNKYVNQPSRPPTPLQAQYTRTRIRSSLLTVLQASSRSFTHIVVARSFFCCCTLHTDCEIYLQLKCSKCQEQTTLIRFVSTQSKFKLVFVVFVIVVSLSTTAVFVCAFLYLYFHFSFIHLPFFLATFFIFSALMPLPPH